MTELESRRTRRGITEEMGLKDAKLRFTGGVDGGRGWPGDVKNMQLDITKLKQLGWRLKHNSKQSTQKIK